MRSLPLRRVLSSKGSGDAAIDLCACFKHKNKISFKGHSPQILLFGSLVYCEIIMKSLDEGTWCFNRGARNGQWNSIKGDNGVVLLGLG